jgi:hypothetical protein
MTPTIGECRSAGAARCFTRADFTKGSKRGKTVASVEFALGSIGGRGQSEMAGAPGLHRIVIAASAAGTA